jgi:Ni2+-binding GTPase involved in maturation of urease and hydrogenase
MARSAGRVAIVGAPGSGKTRLSDLVGREDTLHTDQFIGLPWDQQRDATSRWAVSHPAWVIEGVTAARCLRHQLRPDLVLWVQHKSKTTAKARQLGAAVAAWIKESKVRYVKVV